MPRLLPFLAFALLAIALGIKLFAPVQNTDTSLPLVNETLPVFTLPSILPGEPAVESSSFRQEVTVLNFFASWCLPCAVEHPLLQRLSAEPGIRLIGIAWRDTPQKASAWLAKMGSPYAHAAIDEKASLTAPLGLTGVPETFLIDRRGVIRYRYPGPLTEEEIQQRLLPLAQELRDAP